MSDLGNIGSDASTGAMVGGPWGAAIGAGLGILQSIGGDNAYQAQMAEQEAKERYSGMTGHAPTADPGKPNALGNVVGLSAAGAQLGQGLTTAKEQGDAYNSGHYTAAAQLAAADEAAFGGLGGGAAGPSQMNQMGGAWPGGPLAPNAAGQAYSGWLMNPKGY